MTDTAFWNRIARRYAAKPIGDMTNYDRTLARVVSHLSHEDRVVELGGGTGTTALRLAPAVAEYLGTDASSEMTAIAREKLAADPLPGLSFAVGSERIEGLTPGTLDAVLAFNLYHLVQEVPAAFRRAADVLKPGGLFITKTPCLKGKWYLRPLIAAMQIAGKAPRVTYLSDAELQRMLREAGFSIVETGWYPAPNRFIVARKM